MTERIKSTIKILSAFMIGICTGTMPSLFQSENESIIYNNSVSSSDSTVLTPTFMSQSAKDGLFEALEYYDIHHPDIVYAQAILETGHFTSVGYLKHNNLFGLYDSKAKRYHRFNHWTDGVIAYKEWIQKRYKPPEDYYMFLQRIGYAEDKNYINKLKRIKYDKRRYTEGDSCSKRK